MTLNELLSNRALAGPLKRAGVIEIENIERTAL